MQKVRRRMGIAAILALPIALSASLVTNLEDTEYLTVSNETMTLNHTDGVNDHEEDGNEWISLTAEYVDSTENDKSEGEVPGSTEEGGMTYYYLASDVSLDEHNITITGNVTLCLNGNILRGNESGSVITVSSSASLILDDCKYENTLYPHDYYIDTNNYNIWVFGDSSVEGWNDAYANAQSLDNVGVVYGGVITGGNATSAGGGVAASGTFTMNGGTIAGNYTSTNGGGVYSGRTFTLNNGSISGNRGNYGGAIELVYASAVMNNGSITYNSAGNGGALDMYSSNITIRNGIIAYNSAENSSNTCACMASTQIYVHGGYIDGTFDDQNQSSSFYFYSGYFSSSPSSNRASGYTVVNIANLGGKDYDDAYVDDFDYAVYPVGDTSSFADDTGITLIEDINTGLCASNNLDDIQITDEIKYSSVSYLISEFPTTAGTHSATATLSDVLVEIDGVKTYYDSLTTTFNITISEHVSDNVKQEYIIPATCTSDGSYDEVIYCLVCNEELERTSMITIPATEHTSSWIIIENKVEATCTSDGSYDEVIYCLTCKEELERTPMTIPATEHTSSWTIIENKVEATCTSDGSYDEVIYCLTCGEVISSTPTNIEALGHNAIYFKGQAATTTDTGLLEHWYCLVCNTYFLDEKCSSEVEYEDLVLPMLEDTGNEGLSGGAIAGIVIASIVVVGGIVFLVVFLSKRKS